MKRILLIFSVLFLGSACNASDRTRPGPQNPEAAPQTPTTVVTPVIVNQQTGGPVLFRKSLKRRAKIRINKASETTRQLAYLQQTKDYSDDPPTKDSQNSKNTQDANADHSQNNQEDGGVGDVGPPLITKRDLKRALDRIIGDYEANVVLNDVALHARYPVTHCLIIYPEGPDGVPFESRIEGVNAHSCHGVGLVRATSKNEFSFEFSDPENEKTCTILAITNSSRSGVEFVEDDPESCSLTLCGPSTAFVPGSFSRMRRHSETCRKNFRAVHERLDPEVRRIRNGWLDRR